MRASRRISKPCSVCDECEPVVPRGDGTGDSAPTAGSAPLSW